MNTTAKGDEFEKRVLEHLRYEARSGRLGLQPNCCQFFHKRAYYAHDRARPVIFDLAIELTLPGSHAPSIRIIVECKNHRKSIEASVVELLAAKLESVAGCNNKGIIASTSAFSSTAVQVAQRRGIGLLRFPPDGTPQWELYRSFRQDRTWTAGRTSHVTQGLTAESVEWGSVDCLAIGPDCVRSSLSDLFGDLVRASDLSSSEADAIRRSPSLCLSDVPFIPEVQLEELAVSILGASARWLRPIALDRLFEQECAPRGYRLQQTAELLDAAVGRSVLGSINFDTRTIRLCDRGDVPRTALRFTLAHEIAHCVLDHGRFIRTDQFTQAGEQFGWFSAAPAAAVQRLEWQANRLAACLLMPKPAFVHGYVLAMKKAGSLSSAPRGLWMDEQPCNRALAAEVMDSLAERFRVSRTAALVRLRSLGLVRDDVSEVGTVYSFRAAAMESFVVAR